MPSFIYFCIQDVSVPAVQNTIFLWLFEFLSATGQIAAGSEQSLIKPLSFKFWLNFLMVWYFFMWVYQKVLREFREEHPSDESTKMTDPGTGIQELDRK